MNTHKPLVAGQGNQPRFLEVKFNQDQGCFAIAHENGFHVYNSDPVDSRVERNFKKHHSQSQTQQSHSHQHSNGAGSGIGHISMLHRTNYLALIGGGKHPRFSNNKVVIWDDLKRKTSLTLEFLSPVLNVLLSRIRIVVVLENQVLVYGFSSPPKKFATYETISNEEGLADLSVNSTTFTTNSQRALTLGTLLLDASDVRSFDSDLSRTSNGSGNLHTNGFNGSTVSLGSGTKAKYREKYQILAFPGRSVGQIQLVDVSPTGQEKNLVSIIKAHRSRIRCLTLNRLGTLVASASETGTIIRVHSTHNTALLYEFRRGLDRAVITSMKFSQNDSRLAVLSDKNTLHVFNVGEGPETNTDLPLGQFLRSYPVNRQHLLRNLPIPVPNYFKSTWSFCLVNINKYHAETFNETLSSAESLLSTVSVSDSSTGLRNSGVVGWSGNESIVIVWKNMKIWEKYNIVEKSRPGDEGEMAWEIVRDSWKSLEVK